MYESVDIMRSKKEEKGHPEDFVLYRANASILEKYVGKALKEQGKLSNELVVRTDGSEQTYTVAVYDIDDTGHVMFANKEEFNALMDIIVTDVGIERMHSIRQRIGQDNEMEIIGKNFCKEWQKNWPLKPLE